MLNLERRYVCVKNKGNHQNVDEVGTVMNINSVNLF